MIRGRKSRNDPKAKSKQDRVKVPPPIDPVEMVVLKERYTQYQIIMRALRSVTFFFIKNRNWYNRVCFPFIVDSSFLFDLRTRMICVHVVPITLYALPQHQCLNS